MPKLNRCGQAKVLSDAELSKLRRVLLTDQARLLFDTLRYTGERISAVLQLQKLDAYDPKGRVREVLTFRPATTKTRKTRQVPIHPSLIDTLAHFSAAGDSPWLFPSPTDPSKHLSRQAADEMIRRACERAGLGSQGISSHSFRRTLITKLNSKGTDLKTISKITGHASLRALQLYIEVSEEQVKNAISQL